MSNKIKYIGVESRIHYEIMEAAIYDYLANGTLDKEKCYSHIKQYTNGENRSGKILKHINVLITKNEILLTKLSGIMDAQTFARLAISDRKALLLCLFCNSFPITYDVLIGFAQAFKVQDIVSKEVITHKISSAYGSNRAMHIAVTEILPLLIEFGVIQRVKVGIYSISSKLIITDTFISELIIYTDIKLSGSKSILADELNFKPWYTYFNNSSEFSTKTSNVLISNKDATIGTGYITLK